jgi:hypothetical protein
MEETKRSLVQKINSSDEHQFPIRERVDVVRPCGRFEVNGVLGRSWLAWDAPAVTVFNAIDWDRIVGEE